MQGDTKLISKMHECIRNNNNNNKYIFQIVGLGQPQPHGDQIE